MRVCTVAGATARVVWCGPKRLPALSIQLTVLLVKRCRVARGCRQSKYVFECTVPTSGDWRAMRAQPMTLPVSAPVKEDSR